MRPCAKWTDDCQGKKDYDGRLIDISTRYWPRGGGFSKYDTLTGQWEENDARPGIKPSAAASILLRHGEPDEHGYGEYEDLVEQRFEAETEAEVKALVEAWVQARFDEVAATLRALWGAAE